jgi:biotin carboxyl carrier protein
MKEYKFKINGKDYQVTIGEAEGKMLSVNVNGADYQVELEKDFSATPAASVEMTKAAQTVTPSAAEGSPAPKAPAGAGEKVNSPLPGVIVEVSVKEGQTVTSGQKVAVLEAMKMENEISAPKDGTITAIHVNKGDSILEGAPIVTIA